MPKESIPKSAQNRSSGCALWITKKRDLDALRIRDPVMQLFTVSYQSYSTTCEDQEGAGLHLNTSQLQSVGFRELQTAPQERNARAHTSTIQCEKRLQAGG